MANNYLEFSEILANLSVVEEAWLKEQLEPIRVYGDREFPEDAVPAELADTNADWTGVRFLRDKPDHDPQWDAVGFEYAFHDDPDCGGSGRESWGRHLWFHADESGDPSNVAHLVQKFLALPPEVCWSLTYATTCSRPRVGEFAGGAVFVTAAAIFYENAYDFVESHRAAFRQQAEPLVSAERDPDTGESHVEDHADRGD